MVTLANRPFSIPIAPITLEEAGLKPDLIMQLALKALHFSGELTGASWRAASG